VSRGDRRKRTSPDGARLSARCQPRTLRSASRRVRHPAAPIGTGFVPAHIDSQAALECAWQTVRMAEGRAQVSRKGSDNGKGCALAGNGDRWKKRLFLRTFHSGWSTGWDAPVERPCSTILPPGVSRRISIAA
jgi:hypothetical protein